MRRRDNLVRRHTDHGFFRHGSKTPQVFGTAQSGAVQYFVCCRDRISTVFKLEPNGHDIGELRAAAPAGFSQKGPDNPLACAPCMGTSHVAKPGTGNNVSRQIEVGITGCYQSFASRFTVSMHSFRTLSALAGSLYTSPLTIDQDRNCCARSLRAPFSLAITLP